MLENSGPTGKNYNISLAKGAFSVLTWTDEINHPVRMS